GPNLPGGHGPRNASAPGVSNLTLAFGMTKDLETPLEADTTGGIRYVMLDKPDNNQASWDNQPQVLTAVGASGGPDALTPWAKKTPTRLNPPRKYPPTKIPLLHPLTAHPTPLSRS